MGGACQKQTRTNRSVQPELSISRRTVVWKQPETYLEMRERFVADGSLPDQTMSDEYIQLRHYLDGPIGQRFIGCFAKKILSHEGFFCWIDIQEFRSIPSIDYRRSKLTHIYKKYIKEGSVLSLGFLNKESREEIRTVIDLARLNQSPIPPSTLNAIQHKIFINMFRDTYLPFKESLEYIKMKDLIKSSYNSVTVEDFDYYDCIGEGGFAKVWRVRKKSTKKFYAMKIQRKADLVEMYLDDPNRLMTEKTVFAACHHPFIVDLDYALQTDHCAVLILGLAGSGTLQDVINESPLNRVAIERVQFYAAELILALAHLHDLLLMYRDLKPANVLLCEDGHIQLADMGGVADCGGSVLKVQADDMPDPRLMKDKHGKGRRRSIMGTKGYMAPEMVKLLDHNTKKVDRKGYTYAIDYWSLGITIYKLLTGERPFDRENFEILAEKSVSGKTKTEDLNEEYRVLLQKVHYPKWMPPEAKSLLEGLLEIDENKRLGASGTEILMRHNFFEGVDWDKLSAKHVIPPFIPNANMYPTKPHFNSFDDLFDHETVMAKKKKAGKWKNTPKPLDWFAPVAKSDQQLFETWDFVSPHTLKVEMGIAGEMEAHDTNFKVQQLMGNRTPTNRDFRPNDSDESLSGILSGGVVRRMSLQVSKAGDAVRKFGGKRGSGGLRSPKPTILPTINTEHIEPSVSASVSVPNISLNRRSNNPDDATINEDVETTTSGKNRTSAQRDNVRLGVDPRRKTTHN